MAGFPQGGDPPLLANTLKVLAAVAMVAYVAVNWLPAAPPDRTNGRDANVASRAIVDPETTGSLADAAGQARLDPCAVPLRH